MAVSRMRAAAVTAVLAGAALSGLVLPTQAQASDAGLSLRICNNGSRQFSDVKWTGTWTDGKTHSYWVEADDDTNDKCTIYNGRWKSKQTLTFKIYWKNYTNPTNETCYVSGSSGTKGTCYYKY